MSNPTTETKAAPRTEAHALAERQRRDLLAAAARNRREAQAAPEGSVDRARSFELARCYEAEADALAQEPLPLAKVIPLNSVIATTVPAVRLGDYLAGHIDAKGNPTLQGYFAPVEQEARSHLIRMRDYRESLIKLKADRDLPLREEWIARTADNMDWHRRRLVELLAQRRRMKRELLPVSRTGPLAAE